MGLSLSPTCGLLSLRKASKCIAFLDMTLGLIGIVWFVFMLGKYNIISLDPFEDPGQNNHTQVAKLDPTFSAGTTNKKLSKPHKIIGLTLSALFTFINLALFVVLLLGVHKKHIGLCLTWFYIRTAVIVFKLIIFIMYVIAGRPLFSQIPHIINMLIHIYGIWVVNRYIEELRGAGSKYRKSVGGGIVEDCGGKKHHHASSPYEYDNDGGSLERGGGQDGTVNGIEELARRRKQEYEAREEQMKKKAEEEEAGFNI